MASRDNRVKAQVYIAFTGNFGWKMFRKVKAEES